MSTTRRFTRFAAIGIALVLLAGSGVVHGLLTDRWSTGAELQLAAESLDAVPASLGEWESKPVDVPERQLQQAEAVGHLSRHYVNRATGETVTVLIVCGRPGPISVHPPTVCFTSAGWNLAAEPQKLTLTESPTTAQFWVGDFFKASSAGQVSMRTFWTWSADGSWSTPANPRFTFARYPFLYKLYLLHTTDRGTPPMQKDPALPFLRAFLQQLDENLKKTLSVEHQ